MKAIAVTPRKRTVEIINQAEPQIFSPTDVKLRMLEAGVCGTDREICAFEYGTPPAGCEQLVIGHESLGEVIEIRSESHPRESRRPRRPNGPPAVPARRLRGLPRRSSGFLFHRRISRTGY